MVRPGEWYDVTYRAEGRATPVGDADEGEIGHVVLERADGELELLEPAELNDIEFDGDLVRDDAVIPVEELFEKLDHTVYDEWRGESEIETTVVFDPRMHAIVGLEFDEPVPMETFDDLGLLERECREK